MEPHIKHALKTDRLIDITMIGKKTGKSHKIEIAFHNFDEGLYKSGLPGRRDWYANLLTNPQFMFHLKQSTQTDLPAHTIPVTDTETRRRVLSKVVARWGRQNELEAFVRSSSLVEVQFEN